MNDGWQSTARRGRPQMCEVCESPCFTTEPSSELQPCDQTTVVPSNAPPGRAFWSVGRPPTALAPLARPGTPRRPPCQGVGTPAPPGSHSQERVVLLVQVKRTSPGLASLRQREQAPARTRAQRASRAQQWGHALRRRPAAWIRNQRLPKFCPTRCTARAARAGVNARWTEQRRQVERPSLCA